MLSSYFDQVRKNFGYFIVLHASGLKAIPARKPREEPPERLLLKTSNAKKIVSPQESNWQPLNFRFTALPLELENTFPCMLIFGYLNQATCLQYDFNNKSIKQLVTNDKVFLTRSCDMCQFAKPFVF